MNSTLFNERFLAASRQYLLMPEALRSAWTQECAHRQPQQQQQPQPQRPSTTIEKTNSPKNPEA
jgi:hypothetical protein